MRGEAARLIAEVAPGNLDKVFFTNGGAEAIENAIRMARIYTGRHKVLSMYRSYHGATAGAIALTGDPRRWPSEPAMPGVVHFFGPFPYRSAFFSCDAAEERPARALAHLRDVIQFEGPVTMAAIVVEPVVGTNGILVPPDGYLAGVRAICDEFGIVMIADEVMSGFGRCGQWFAVDEWAVTPDLITFAKGVNSGYVPLGGVIIGRHIADHFDERVFPGGLTTRAIRSRVPAPLRRSMRSEKKAWSSTRGWLGADVIGPGLRAIAERHPSVGEVRGLGVFWAIELVRNHATREPLVGFNAVGCGRATHRGDSLRRARRAGCGPLRGTTASTWSRRATPSAGMCATASRYSTTCSRLRTPTAGRRRSAGLSQVGWRHEGFGDSTYGRARREGVVARKRRHTGGRVQPRNV